MNDLDTYATIKAALENPPAMPDDPADFAACHTDMARIMARIMAAALERTEDDWNGALERSE